MIISSCPVVLKLIQGTLPNYLNEHFTVNNQVLSLLFSFFEYLRATSSLTFSCLVLLSLNKVFTYLLTSLLTYLPTYQRPNPGENLAGVFLQNRSDIY